MYLLVKLKSKEEERGEVEEEDPAVMILRW